MILECSKCGELCKKLRKNGKPPVCNGCYTKGQYLKNKSLRK